MKKVLLTASSCLALALVAEIHAQKFLPDDPIWRDDDNLSIAKPALLELGLFPVSTNGTH